MRPLLFAFPLIVISIGIDLIVFRAWRRYALDHRRRLGWTLPVYRVLLVVMPFVLPAYFLFSRWWEVDPKLPRAIIIGIWAVYYLPRVPVAAFLMLSGLVSRTAQFFKPRPVTPLERPDTIEIAATSTAPPSMSRRDALRTLGWVAAGVPAVVVAAGVARTLYDFRVRYVDVPIAGLPRQLDGFTIAQLSDLHAGSLFGREPMDEAVRLVLAHRPNLVVITGDYVNHDHRELGVIADSLGGLRSDLGVLGCLGNHDHYADVDALAAGLRETPVHLLVNAHRTYRIGGANLHVIGTDNTGFNQHYADLGQAKAGLQAHPHGEDVRILLAHDPTFWDNEVRPLHPDIDVMLAGHTHGGQIGFEFGPFGWSPARAVYRRWAGLYQEPARGAARDQHLYVNRGVGTVGPPIRIGIHPEVTLLTLRPGSGAA